MESLSILCPFDIFYGYLVYFVVIRYISPVLEYCTKKNLTTLVPICQMPELAEKKPLEQSEERKFSSRVTRLVEFSTIEFLNLPKLG
jgi:hypothetical protein